VDRARGRGVGRTRRRPQWRKERHENKEYGWGFNRSCDMPIISLSSQKLKKLLLQSKILDKAGTTLLQLLPWWSCSNIKAIKIFHSSWVLIIKF
jgi:hypothetical protein